MYKNVVFQKGFSFEESMQAKECVLEVSGKIKKAFVREFGKRG